jgi:hypothetical protein
LTTGNSATLNFGLENSTYNNDEGNAQIKAITNGLYGASTDLVYSLWNGTAFAESVRMRSTGNVLIGKSTQTNSAYKLDVSGTIRANEVVINTTGADFVFASDYKLPALSEVELFIKENNHLPDIAPAAEMKENGMNVSEIQTKLLQKVEELTLYLLEQSKIIHKQEKEIGELKKDIDELKSK